MTRSWQRGLYAVADLELIAAADLTARVEAAIAGGAVLIQYRDKRGDAAQRRARAQAVLNCCRARGVPLIVNDDAALAAAVGADGVHLGRDDAAVAAARRQLGPRAIIGVSCYNQLSRAVAAAEAGADYAAFGRFFPSRSKPAAAQAEPDLLSRARRRLNIPLVAIGGIAADNGAALIAAGADLLAAIHGVFGQADVERAARDIAGLFAETASNRGRPALRSIA